MNNKSRLLPSFLSHLKATMIWLCLFSFSSSLMTAQEAYLLGDDNNNQFTEIKSVPNNSTLQDKLYATGIVTDNVGSTYGTFSEIDLITGAVLWTTRLPIRSSLSDFIWTDEEFIAVGRTEPVQDPTTGAWMDNRSLACRISLTGAILQTRIYDVDQDGGREGFTKIIHNHTPSNPNFPFYIAGHVDADNTGSANSVDDLVITNINFNLDPLFTRRYASALAPNVDDEYQRVFLPMNDGSGNMVLMGDEGQGGTVLAVAFYINNNGNVIGGSERYFANFTQNTALEVIYDAMLLPNEGFMMVGRDVQNTNFIMKTDFAFNPIWTEKVLQHREFVELIYHEDAYYVIMLERLSTNQDRYLVNRIKDNGAGGNLEWTKTLHDNDNTFSHPFIYSTGSQIAYGNSRIPDASGQITSGYGAQDIMLAVTDATLETCITQEVPTEMMPLEIFAQDRQIQSITIDMPWNDFDNWESLQYVSTKICDDPSNCPADCVANSIIINTGYDHVNGTTYASGEYDAFWELIQSPDGVGIPRPAYVVTPSVAWDNQTNTSWISAYPFANFNQNNPPPETPYTFQFCFCVCEDNTDVTFDLSAYADNNVYIDLYDDVGGFIMDLLDITDPTTAAFQAPPDVTTATATLNEGTYCIRADLHNLSSVAMGFNLMGTISGSSLLEPLCCSDANYITGFKFNDTDCNGEFSGNTSSEPLLSGWDIQVCDALNNVVATATTDAFGLYVIPNLPPGTYTVKEVNQPGWVQTYPGGSGVHTVTIGANEVIGDINFGNIDPRECNCTDFFFTENPNPDHPEDCCYDIILDTDIADYYTGVKITPMGGSFTGWEVNAADWNYVGVPTATGIQIEHISGTIPAGSHNAINICISSTTTVLIEWLVGDEVICENDRVLECDHDPCINLMAMFDPIPNPHDECCYEVDLKNYYGNNLTRFEMTIVTPGVIFNSGTVSGGYTWDVPNTTSTNLSVDFGGSNLPMGDFADVIDFCLANTTGDPIGATTIVYRWYEQIPGTPEVAICEQTITLQCIIFDPPPCVELIDIRVECDEDGNYVFKFKVKNNTGSTADHVLFYNIAPAGFVFDDIYPSFPPLGPGLTSGDICLLITPGSPVLSPTNLCFDIALFGTSPNGDAYPCCFAEDEVCITLDPCCDPCEGTAVDAKSIQVDPTNPNEETCCWALDLVNECEPSIFTKIEIEVVTPGVIFGAHFTGGASPADWNNPLSLPTRIQWAHNSGTIPNGFMADVINFCLDDIDDASEVPQTVVVKWITTDAAGNDVIACEDVLTFDCPFEDYHCAEITEDVITCNSDGTYTYCFTVTNTSTGMHDATHILLNPTSPAGVTFSPDAFNEPLAYGASVTICTIISGPLSAGDKVTFEVRLANLTSDDHWCCFESEEHCITIPDCEPDCCDVSQGEFHNWVQQGFTWMLSNTTDCNIITAMPNYDFDEECDEVTWKWDDGTPDNVTLGNNPVTHTYPLSPGTYNVCMMVTRYDPITGEICREDQWCTTITIDCPPIDDCCPVNPNIFATWVDEGFSWTNNCLDLTVVPNHDFDENCDRVTWNWGDGSPQTTSIGNTAVTHTYPSSGWYVICMDVVRTNPVTGEVCAHHRIYQEVYVEDCECECDESFYDDVNAGFTVTTGVCRNRTITANNVGLNDCDKVVWSVRSPGQPGIGFMGTSFNYNFPHNGIFEICMYVTRTNPITGEVCEYVYCRRIRIRCVLQIDPWVVVNTVNVVNNYGFATLINPLTNNGTNQRMADWEVAMGTPETIAGTGCDDDNYAELSGNKTVVDGLQQLIELEADTYYEFSHCYQFLTAQYGQPKAGTKLVVRISKTAQTSPNCVGDCDEIGRFSLPTNTNDDWASSDQTPYYSGDMSGSVYLTIHLENGVPDDGTDASKSFINIDNILLEAVSTKCVDIEQDVTIDDLGAIQVGDPFVQAQNDIASNRTIGEKAVATYRAGNSVTLTGGFETQLGAEFTAEIGTCELEENFTDHPDHYRLEDHTDVTTDKANSLYCYPNPFSNNATIEYQVSTSSQVQISVFNMTGKQVANLLPHQNTEAGQYQVTFDAANLPDGIYYVRMAANGQMTTQKIVLLNK